MPNKIEKPITTFMELETTLKPFVLKISENKKKISNLQKGLDEYQKKFEIAERKLTDLLKKSEEALAEGGTIKFNDSIFAAKQEKTDLEEWISQIKNESIPQAQAALKTAIKELGEKFLEEVNPLRLAYLERVRVIYAQADAIWDSYLLEVKTMLGEMLNKFDIVFQIGELDQIFVKDFRLLKKE
jgi:DNA repair ATPase RecN